MMRRARFIRLLCVALLAGAMAPGCAHRRTAAQPAPVPTASPGVRGTAHGLEMWWWVVADPRPVRIAGTAAEEPPLDGAELTADGAEAATGKPPPVMYEIRDDRIALEAALRPHLERAVPLPAELRERWRGCGLRVVAVPPEDLAGIESAIRIVGPVHRQWLGEMTDWTDIVRGPRFAAGPVETEDGVVRMEAGRLRLLARSWSVPEEEGAGMAGALRLELVPQHEPEVTDVQRFAAALRPVRRPDQVGEVFPRLAVGVTVTGPDALVIVPDSPGAQWSEDAAPALAGLPNFVTVPTLGELMLSSPATERASRTRAVLVLIPHARERYELLP